VVPVTSLYRLATVAIDIQGKAVAQFAQQRKLEAAKNGIHLRTRSQCNQAGCIRR
jgi:hypothetical protein